MKTFDQQPFVFLYHHKDNIINMDEAKKKTKTMPACRQLSGCLSRTKFCSFSTTHFGRTRNLRQRDVG